MDPLNNSPLNPMMGQMPPAQEAQPTMATPEQKQDLLDLVQKIKGNLANLNTAKFQAKNSGERGRIDTLKEIFSILRRAGVDLEDPNSVNAFLEQLRAKSPELASLLEEALTQILGGEQEQPEQSMMPQEQGMLQPPPPTGGTEDPMSQLKG
jgi:hypothetical protein